MDTTSTEDLGAIKAARLRKGWTQGELADKAGVSLSLIQKLEAGRKPHRNNLANIKAALEIADSNECSETAPWSDDVALILNAVGLFLEGLTPAERRTWATRIMATFRNSL